MYWVMLTRPTGENVYVNLERFDTVAIDGNKTVITATLSQTEEDFIVVEVVEKPDDFVPLMGS